MNFLVHEACSENKPDGKGLIERTNNTYVLKIKGIRVEKHLQCEELLGLAGGNTSMETRNPARA